MIECSFFPCFCQNGDYNKPIPAQYMEHLNHVVSGSPTFCDPAKPQQWVSSQILLCKKCNNHQTMKIKQLASFSPREEVSVRNCHHWRVFVQGIPIHASTVPALFSPCCSLVGRRESSFSVCCGMMLQQASEALRGTPVLRSSVINVANLPNSTSKLECSPVLDEH